MAYAIKHLSELNIAELMLSGLITGADLRNATTECILVQRRTGVTRFLIDANGWEVAASPVDIFELPARQYWEEGVKRESRMAVILPHSLSGREAAHNYETMCQNRGWDAKVWPDRQTAIKWLTDTK